MTLPSLKKLRTTRRSTLRILFDDAARGLLSLAVVCGGAAVSEAGVRDVFTKSSPKSPTVSAKANAPVASTRSTTINKLGPKRKPTQLMAQSDEPLDRLKQRDAEQRFRDVLSEDDDSYESESGKSAVSPSTPRAKNDESYQQKELTEPAPIQPPEVRIATRPQDQPGEGPVPEPVTSPIQLKPISAIQPFYDYRPASAIKGEACWDLCPRPDGMPCKPDELGNMPECPSEFRLSDAAYANRMYSDCLYQWRASDQYYNPLYFEDPALERYGHVHHELVQPFVSVARFGVQLVGLPYQMTIDPVCKKMYNLGYYRPGECAPKKHYRIPWNTHAAINEAAVWTGLVFIFP
ncbi:MAG: hypothetical protein ACKV2Q_06080 [Planctomycetaceae bacterium]